MNVRSIVFFIGGIFFGLLFSIALHINTPTVRSVLSYHISQQLQKTYTGVWQCSIKHISFFPLSITFDQLLVSDDAHEWYWKVPCGAIEATISTWSPLRIGLNITVDEMNLYSRISNGIPAIIPHLEQIVLGKPIIPWIAVESLTLQHTHVMLEDDMQRFQAHMNISTVHASENPIHSIRLLEGLYQRTQEAYTFSRIHGFVYVQQHNQVQHPFSCRLDIRAQMNHPVLPSSIVHITGSMQNGHGRFSCINSDHSIHIDPIVISQISPFVCRFRGKIPLELMPYTQTVCTVTGSLDIQGECTYHNNMHAACYLMSEDVKLGGVDWPLRCKGIIALSNERMNADMMISHHGLGDVTINGAVDIMHGIGSCVITSNEIKIPLHYKNILLHHVVGKINWSSAFSNINIQGLIGDKPLTITIKKNNDNIHGDYAIGDIHGTGIGVFSAHDTYMHISCAEKDVWVADIQATDNWGIQGSFSIHHMQKYLYWLLSDKNLPILTTNGQMHIRMHRLPLDMYAIRLWSPNMHMKFPGTSNGIHQFSCALRADRYFENITFEKLLIGLHHGLIQVGGGYIERMDSQINMQFPITFNKCFIQCSPDIQGTVSGAGLLQYVAGHTSLRGHCIIERGLLGESIFSRKWFSDNAVSFSVCTSLTTDIMIETKRPLSLKTKLLDIDFHSALHMTGVLPMITLQGTFESTQGMINFPYKPLYIRQGKLMLVPGSIDPLIDVRAHNKIRNIDVHLVVNGTLQEHHAILTSNPSLSQEQCMSLLLLGSAHESLNMLMPALVLQHIKNMVVDTSHIDFFERLFVKSKRSFFVQLIPQFTEQNGRGGIRGSLEIMVNDRLRALLQKNFNLTEDTRFELEYQVADDVVVRASRDQRSDIGAEIEMRWKF